MAPIISISTETLLDILDDQCLSPTNVLTCNGAGWIAVPLRFGYSSPDYVDLRDKYPFLRIVVERLLEIEPRGGRFEVTRNGAYHIVTRTWLCRFKLTDA